MDRERASIQSGGDHLRHHAAVIPAHRRPVRIEWADDVGADAGLAPGRDDQGLPEALRFVIARPRADGVHVSPVLLGLRMDQWVTVDLGRGHVQERGTA